ncbi:PHP domain-containing protein [Alicyclobacillus cycloheptanicus]|uniref:DNA-directed DNA polymerase n=1 Tax=Alicyclobacillus cycloheptanicus TaxID=1457 RepID=A0ABT9XJ47_9BACL|nr:helix-hairpin-helix domain-containing protein [Alicyclobacillus cycloheptanicus]MDQ0190330.1 DNA polymerase (family 10) [Alicyclobacillus cycloheptanicus]WDM00027.1 PHP domain-containing protein [Alicyclobacillus cycloheptanicus]
MPELPESIQPEQALHRLIEGLRDLAALLEIDGPNPHQARALRGAADHLAASELPVETRLAQPTRVPGIGPKTADVIRHILAGGVEAARTALAITTPPSACDLLRVSGIGPKTAHALVHHHGIDSLQALHNALADGTLRTVPGFGPARIERLKRDAAVLIERQTAWPIAEVWPLAEAMGASLRRLPGVVHAEVTGGARRLLPMCPGIEVVVAETDAAEDPPSAGLDGKHTGLASLPHRAKSADAGSPPVHVIRTTPDTFALRLMETTGDDTHQQVIEGLLRQAGYEWTRAGIVDSRGVPVAVSSEADIYALIGLPYIPPELREGRGLLCPPDRLVQRVQIQGDLHVHTHWSDGSLSIVQAAAQAEALGYAYIAITDHSQSLAIAGGLTPERVWQQWEEIERVQSRTSVRILRGMEVDILADGRLDMPDELLDELDIVIASIHSAMHQPADVMTKRLLAAVRHPAVDIIGHPTGRLIGRRAAYPYDFEAVLAEAARRGVMMELNANPNRLDLSDDALRQCRAAGVLISVNTDAHHAHEFEFMAYGVRMAWRGWLTASDVLNTRPIEAVLARLHRDRQG